MAVKFSNNAVTSLTDSPSAGATFFNVASASAFPTLASGDWTYVSLTSEVVKVTAISGTTFTCDATSNAHASGESVELRMTAELLNDFAEDTEALPLAGGTMTGDVSLGDNVKAKFGAGADLRIYHDGGNSYISDTGAGNLKIKSGAGFDLQTTTGENYLDAVENAAINLYYDNSKKLATTSTGIDVTGSVTCDGFTSTGIDDNATSTAITIDASERVSIKGVDGAPTVQGTGTGNLIIRGRSNSGAIGILQLDKQGDSGNVIDFRSGTTIRGNIGLASDGINVHTGNAGAIYLGGTAAANALDDYEEGTWTPTFLNTTVSAGPNNTTGRYTKIGNIVHVNYYGNGLALAGGTMQMGGLPFTVASSTSYSTFHYVHGTASTGISTGGFFSASTNILTFIQQNSTTEAVWATGSTKYLMISGTYTVA